MGSSSDVEAVVLPEENVSRADVSENRSSRFHVIFYSILQVLEKTEYNLEIQNGHVLIRSIYCIIS